MLKSLIEQYCCDKEQEVQEDKCGLWVWVFSHLARMSNHCIPSIATIYTTTKGCTSNPMETMTKMGVFAVLPARRFPLLSSALVRVVDNSFLATDTISGKMITDVSR